MEATKELVKACQTCLYCATKCKCDGCLHTKEDYAAYHAGGRVAMPDFRFLNWTPGNWLEGKRNIVIGGYGEAEVNTMRTPEETSKQLHSVAEECGYLCRNLRKTDLVAKLFITVHGHFELEWRRHSTKEPYRLDNIWCIVHDPQTGEPLTDKRSSVWSRESCEIWPPEASEPKL